MTGSVKVDNNAREQCSVHNGMASGFNSEKWRTLARQRLSNVQTYLLTLALIKTVSEVDEWCLYLEINEVLPLFLS